MRTSEIRGAIRAKGHTLESLAIALGKAPSTISNWLSGKTSMTLDDAMKMSSLLDLEDHPEFFLGNEVDSETTLHHLDPP